jgi:hypothetical protein
VFDVIKNPIERQNTAAITNYFLEMMKNDPSNTIVSVSQLHVVLIVGTEPLKSENFMQARLNTPTARSVDCRNGTIKKGKRHASAINVPENRRKETHLGPKCPFHYRT